MLVVLDKTDDFELEPLSVARLDDENVAEFDLPASIRSTVLRVDGSLLVQVASDVRVVLGERA